MDWYRQSIISYFNYITDHENEPKMQVLEEELYYASCKYPISEQIFYYYCLFYRIANYLPFVLNNGKSICQEYFDSNIDAINVVLMKDPNNIKLSVREEMRQKIQNFLELHEKFKYIAFQTSTEIEESCYAAVIENSKHSDELVCRRWDTNFKNIYDNKCYTILQSIDINSIYNKLPSTTIMLEKILSGEISIDRIGYLSSQQICPEAYANETAMIQLRNAQKIVQKISTLFRCPKCKGNETTYIERQTRSLDELATIYCTCTNPLCGFKFRA